MAAIALAGAQAGHLIAYQIRFGPGAVQVQSTGAHAYFLAPAKTAIGIVALAAVATLFMVGFGRLVAGRRLEADSAGPFMRTLAAMYTLQLGVFVVQETVEAIAGRGHLLSVPALLLWGAAGQLPVALGASLAWRWLGARVRPALAAIHVPNAVQPLVPALAPVALPSVQVVAAPAGRRGSFTRRGPPSF